MAGQAAVTQVELAALATTMNMNVQSQIAALEAHVMESMNGAIATARDDNNTIIDREVTQLTERTLSRVDNAVMAKIGEERKHVEDLFDQANASFVEEQSLLRETIKEQQQLVTNLVQDFEGKLKAVQAGSLDEVDRLLKEGSS